MPEPERQSFPKAPTVERLQGLIDAMAGQTVAVLADLVVDRFVHGVPKRISREAPVLILRHESEELIPGGGANAVANIAALGGRPLPLGAVGDDAVGHALLELFEKRGIPTHGVTVRADYRTPTKTRVLAGARHAIKQQIVRFDVEDLLTPTAADRATWLDAVERELPSVGAAILSDYGYGAVEPGLVPALRGLLASRPMLGDSRYRLREFVGLDGATPNAEEAEALADRAFTGERRDLASTGAGLLAGLGFGFLLITRGGSGMSLFEAGRAAHLPVHGTAQVADVTGAGDTVIGSFALALAAGATPLEAMCLANYAGGIVVMKMGTATLSRDELRAAVSADTLPLEGLEWDRS